MPTRQYQDPSGTEWEVFEVHRLSNRPASVRPALSSGWLAFVSPGERRRLPSYPSEWMHLSDDELHELLLAAVVAMEPARSPDRPSGSMSTIGQEESGRLAEPRIRPSLGPLGRQGKLSSAGVVRAETAAHVAGRLPAAAPATATATGGLGSAEVEALVRAHARQARAHGVPIIQGMIGVRQTLAGQGADVSPDAVKRLRSLFVEEYYFSS